jgi:hypothetical protein
MASKTPTKSANARHFLNIHLCGAQDVGHEDEFFVGNASKDFLGASIQVIAIPPA